MRGFVLAVLLFSSSQLLANGATPAFRSIADYHHTAWTADQGSPGDTWAMAQTPDGWVWLGGPRGVFRFDGVEFEPLAMPGLKPGQSSAVHSMLATPTGDLWVGHVRGGITRIRGDDARHYGDADGLPVASVFSIALDAEGVAWAATSAALLRLEGERWQQVGVESGFTDKNPTSVRLDRAGTLWIGGQSALFRLRRGAKLVESTGLSLAGDAGTDFTMGADGRLWYLDYAGLHLLPDQVAGLPGPAHPNSVRSSHALLDSEGYLWTTPVKGLLRHSVPEGARAILYETSQPGSFGEKEGLTGRAHTAFEDQEGNIWFVTRGGIDRFRPSNVRKVSLDGERSPNSALAAGEDGAVWLGVHHGGLGRGPLEGMWKVQGQEAVRVLPKVIPPVTAVHRDPTGAVWAGGWEGLWRMEAGGRLTKLPEFPPDARHQIHAITVDAAGDPWVSVVQSVLFRLRDGKWEPNGNLAALPSGRPTFHARDGQGRLWFGYRDNQIAMVDAGRVMVYGESQGMNLGTITAIHAGRFFAVAGERGFSIFEDGRFHMLRDDLGTSALEGVTGIVEAHDGDLWVNGFRGAVRISAGDLADAVRRGHDTVPVETFDSQDGFPGQAQNIRGVPTLIRASDDRLWFAGTLGVGWIDPRNLRRNAMAPRVLIRSASSADQVYPADGPIQLPKGTQDLQIKYTALSMSRPEKIRFRYRLSGYDQAWAEAGSRRQAFYTNLRPGEYVFQVIAANESGVWNEVGVSQRIFIPPAFVQTWTFAALCLVAGLLLVFGGFLLRLRQVTLRERGRLEDRLNEREHIARDLHDTLLQGIQGLILRLQATVDRADVPDQAKLEIAGQLDRAEKLLIDGRERVRNLRSTTAAPEDLRQALADSANQLGSEKLSIVQVGTPRELHPLVREEAERIATEAMLNAVRHADAGSIKVELRYERGQLCIEIRDDGRGMEETVTHEGRAGHFGITGMHERARRIRGTLTVVSGPSAGTHIALNVPAKLAYVRRRWLRRR